MRQTSSKCNANRITVICLILFGLPRRSIISILDQQDNTTATDEISFLKNVFILNEHLYNMYILIATIYQLFYYLFIMYLFSTCNTINSYLLVLVFIYSDQLIYKCFYIKKKKLEIIVVL